MPVVAYIRLARAKSTDGGIPYARHVTQHPRTAITGGTGFVGRHLAERLGPEASVVISRRTGVDTGDVDALARAFEGCEVVAHCAGINREIGDQTYQRVHIEGTANVIEAAKRAGVRKVIMLSFLRARPDCGSPYHESKWAAEELIRDSGLDYTILKAGMIYGRGDHLIDHLSHTVQTLPVFATVGFREKPIRPIPIDDLTDILVAAIDGRMPRAPSRSSAPSSCCCRRPCGAWHPSSAVAWSWCRGRCGRSTRSRR